MAPVPKAYSSCKQPGYGLRAGERQPDRAYYDRKIAEGKTHKESPRSLKRQVRNVIYVRLQADASQCYGLGRAPGERL